MTAARLHKRLFPPGMRIVDLTVRLSAETPIFPSDPPFRRSLHVTSTEAGYRLSRVDTGLHVGTHVDAPLHFLERGADVASMPVQAFLGDAVAIDAPKQPGEDIVPTDLAVADIRPGDIVLVRTGWEVRAGTAQFFRGEWPGFSASAIDALIALQVKAIGGDMPSADSPAGLRSGAAAHRRAMAAGLPIFEALCGLREVVGRRFVFVGLPLKIEGAEGSPVRAVAILTTALQGVQE